MQLEAEISNLLLSTIDIIISLPESDSGADLSFTRDVLFFFLPTRDLRDAWADRREILHDG